MVATCLTDTWLATLSLQQSDWQRQEASWTSRIWASRSGVGALGDGSTMFRKVKPIRLTITI